MVKVIIILPSVGKALYDDVSGSFNVAIGREAGSNNVSGNNNVFIGYQSAFGSHGNSPAQNTGVGFRSLYSISTGTYNVAFGYDSGKSISSGTKKYNNWFIWETPSQRVNRIFLSGMVLM